MKFEFTGLISNEQQNIFLNLRTTNIAIGDNKKNTDIKGLVVFDDNTSEIDYLDLEVLRSHDPNDIAVSPTCIPCEDLNNKYLYYTVRFQNEGNAKTDSIEVTVETPAGINNNSIDGIYVDHQNFNEFPYNECAGNTNDCWKKKINANNIVFTFYNAELPGSANPAIDDFEKTTGSFSYRLKLNNNINCNSALESKASILFDANTPIVTNTAKTSFAKTLGFKQREVKIGAENDLANDETGGFLGLIFRPSENCRKNPYNQFELLAGYNRYNCNESELFNCKLHSEDSTNLNIKTHILKSDRFYLGIVPIHLRYNLTSLLSAGAGAEFRASYVLYNLQATNETDITTQNSFEFDSSIFADVNANFNKLTFGLRYYAYGFELGFENNEITNTFYNTNRLQAYLQFKLN